MVSSRLKSKRERDVQNLAREVFERSEPREEKMATKAHIAKSKRTPKFSTRQVNRCQRCGRAKSYMRDFGLCRICMREMAHSGYLPGIRKASW